MTALVVFSGLPGVGKTTLARQVAQSLGATYLRIDTIEVAVARSGLEAGEAPVGYLVAAGLAVEQLRIGLPVVSDAVNSVEIARVGWREVARETRAELRLVHVVCSDPDEHRRRVESRLPDLDGHVPPTWTEVRRRSWEPLTDPHLTVDNVGDTRGHVEEILTWVRAG